MKTSSKFWVFFYVFVVITCGSLIIGMLLTVYFNQASPDDRIFWSSVVEKTIISFVAITSLLLFLFKKFVKVEEVNWDDFLKEHSGKTCQPNE